MTDKPEQQNPWITLAAVVFLGLLIGGFVVMVVKVITEAKP